MCGNSAVFPGGNFSAELGDRVAKEVCGGFN